ncbi:TATA box-binding protein-associated factor RNA polymerase I subunit B [Aplochiton taeniatus]
MDEEETAGYRVPCSMCSAVDWGVSDEGRFYCRSCHNVIERTREVGETDFMLGFSRVSSISKERKGKKTRHGREWMVCEGFQFILKQQAEALVNMGVCPHFKDDVLCQFWRMYLQMSQQAFTNNPVHTSKFKMCATDSESESLPESSIMSASEADGETDWTSASGHSTDGHSSVCSGSLDAGSYLSPHTRRTGKLMSMQKTLALCYLGLLWAREALTLADLLRLVNEGHIPYVNAHEGFPEEILLYGKDALIFRAESIPSHRDLHQEAHNLATFLKLPAFPSITQDCLLHPSLLTLRYLTEANLPDELHDWVSRIVEQVGMSDESLHTYAPMKSKAAHLPLYDVQAAALIIVAMKLLFRLDDHTEWELSNDSNDMNMDSLEENSFSVRRWYKLMQASLTKAKQKQTEYIARKLWKSKKPLYPSLKQKSIILKRSRVSEQLQNNFQKLSGASPGPAGSAPSSFRFQWGEGEGVDGPSMHQKGLDSVVVWDKGALRPSNTVYWHPVLKLCNSWVCKSHYKEVEATLPKMYLWLLELFAFLLGVRPGCVYEEVLKLERLFLRSRSQTLAEGRHRKVKQPQQTRISSIYFLRNPCPTFSC